MLVSVIIPCYNVQDYIEECLQSVYSQTYSEIEIICVDNNSTDNTFELLKKHKEQGKIKLYQELKKGAPAARNLGLKHAKGKWIQFLDADDLLLPNKINHQMGLISKNLQGGVVAGSYNKMDIKGNTKIYLPDEDIILGLLKSNLGITSANLFHRLTIVNIASWNENIESSQEYDLMFRIIKNGSEVIYDNEALTIIRERGSGQISQSNPKKKWFQYMQLRMEIVDYLMENDPNYYNSHEKEIKQILFDSNRILAKYDLQKASEIYDKYLKHFTPSISPATTKNYLGLYRIFGFYNAEKIKKWLN